MKFHFQKKLNYQYKFYQIYYNRIYVILSYKFQLLWFGDISHLALILLCKFIFTIYKKGEYL